MTEQEIRELLTCMSRVDRGLALDDVAVRTWHELLADLSYEQAWAAANAALREKSVVTPADVRRFAEDAQAASGWRDGMETKAAGR